MTLQRSKVVMKVSLVLFTSDVQYNLRFLINLAGMEAAQFLRHRSVNWPDPAIFLNQKLRKRCSLWQTNYFRKIPEVASSPSPWAAPHGEMEGISSPPVNMIEGIIPSSLSKYAFFNFYHFFFIKIQIPVSRVFKIKGTKSVEKIYFKGR